MLLHRNNTFLVCPMNKIVVSHTAEQPFKRLGIDKLLVLLAINWTLKIHVACLIDRIPTIFLAPQKHMLRQAREKCTFGSINRKLLSKELK